METTIAIVLFVVVLPLIVIGGGVLAKRQLEQTNTQQINDYLVGNVERLGPFVVSKATLAEWDLNSLEGFETVTVAGRTSLFDGTTMYVIYVGDVPVAHGKRPAAALAKADRKSRRSARSLSNSVAMTGTRSDAGWPTTHRTKRIHPAKRLQAVA